MAINNNPLVKRTPAQLALIHTAESVGITVLLGLVGSIYQFLGSNSFSLHALIPFIGGTFLGALSMIYKTLTANPNLGPAMADTINQFKAEVQLLLASHFQGIAQLLQQTQQAQVPAPPAQPQVQPVRQVPFPDSPSIPMAALSSSQIQPKP